MNILQLPIPFETPPGMRLPGRDEFGIPYGKNYQSFKDARQARWSTRSTSKGLKFNRRIEALSQNEERPSLAFQFNPYVLDARWQYPVYDQRKFDQAIRAGERMAANSVMTIDVILTLVLPPDNQIKNHGISIKDARHIFTEADIRRHDREREALAERGWTWECLRGNQFSRRTYANHFELYRSIRETNVLALYEKAKWFSEILLRSSLRGTYGKIMARIGNRLEISVDDAHRLFAVACAFGFVTIDHSEELRADSPLHLIM
jgi:hypothetical protein